MNDYILESAAVLISVIALGFTIYDRKKQEKNIQETDRKAEKALKLSQGNLELSLRNSISEGRHRLNLAIKDLQTFKLVHPDADITIMKKLFYSSLEDLINHYDRGCMLYLDDKIDKNRFETEYAVEIRNLVEKGEYKERYFPAHTSKFKAVLKVYDNWENKEK